MLPDFKEMSPERRMALFDGYTEAALEVVANLPSHREGLETHLNQVRADIDTINDALEAFGETHKRSDLAIEATRLTGRAFLITTVIGKHIPKSILEDRYD